MNVLKGPELAAYMSRKVNAGLEPHMERIVGYWGLGYLPVVAYEPQGETLKMLDQIFPARGAAKVWATSRRDVAPIFRGVKEQEWLNTQPTEGGPIHVWWFLEEGNLCMVLGENGWHVADGTTDLDQN